MKKIIILLTAIFFVLILLSCEKQQADGITEQDKDQTPLFEEQSDNPIEETSNNNVNLHDNEKVVLSVYLDFINGNISLNQYDLAQISAGDNPLINPSEHQYALLDMNDDDIPELLIQPCYILTYKNGDLSLWWSDRFYGGYTLLLENGDVLRVRPGGAPTHTNYQYSIFDKDGSEKEYISFAKWDSDEDGVYDYFQFEDDDNLTEDEWNQLTQPYLSVPEIEWKDYSDIKSFITDRINQTK